MRRFSKTIKIGDRFIGGDNPILIQSMTNTRTEDADATIAQIRQLERAGCEIVRCAVPTKEAASALKTIKKAIGIPLVADIHFDYRLALAAIDSGADKIRINPGNIGGKEKVRAVAQAAKEKNIPIRVGVNSGSVEKSLLEKYGGVCAEALVESALKEIGLIEAAGYDNIVVSIKSSNVRMCIDAYIELAKHTDYPLHIGITETGTAFAGSIKSAVGLGTLLYNGIGDTIRVSLSAEPVEEIKTARLILKSLGLKNAGVDVIACPTCGRTNIDLISLAKKTEELAAAYPYDIKLAVMGCAVNGPGEAREADLGIAGGTKEGLLFKKGKIIKKVPEDELLITLKHELDNWGKG